MSHESARRSSNISSIPSAGASGTSHAIPRAPPLPAPKSLQRARDGLRAFIGYPSRPQSPLDEPLNARFAQIGVRRQASLGAAENASLTHKTGLEINTIAINEKGTHALLGGKEIFKTLKVVDGTCVEDLNLRTAIRSTPTQASGKPRQVYSIDIADVAWAKGDCGDYVAAATSSGKIILYDLGHAGLQAAQLHEHYRQVHRVTFNPHRGNLLLSGSQDGTVRLWDVRDARSNVNTLQSKRKFLGQTDSVRDVKWSPTDGVDFAFGTDSGWIQRWDMRNMKTAKVKIPAHSTACNSIDWHPDGKHVASAGSDKTVRVWDLSTNKRGKAHWEIKTPYAVLNARWRPPCTSAMPHDDGAMQCTQIVTSYDREHPIMHLWDFRRQSLPFRELTPFHSGATDLIWHSQDLLWIVGREGIFQQRDIQHTPKVVANRNLQAFGISSQGEISFVTQKRRQHRHPRPQPLSDVQGRVGAMSSSPSQNLLSRSWADDSLDHSFLSMMANPPRSRTASSGKQLPSSATPPYRQVGMQAPMVKLDDILLKPQSSRPHQASWQGMLPYLESPSSFAFLAKKYVLRLDHLAASGSEIAMVQRAFDENARVAKATGLHRLSQTWKIVGFAVVNHLKKRAEAGREQGSKGEMLFPKRQVAEQLSVIARRIVNEMTKSPSASPAASPASMRPISTIAQILAAPESTSNVTTPIAKPVSPAKVLAAPSQKSAPLPDPDKDETLALLPPLLAPPLPSPAMKGATPSPIEGKLTAHNLHGLEKLQPPASGIDRIDMARKWSVQAKAPLTLDPVDPNGQPVNRPRLLKHDSDESFRFLAGSTDSQGPSLPASFASSDGIPKELVSAHPTRPMPTPVLKENVIPPTPIESEVVVRPEPILQTSNVSRKLPQPLPAVSPLALPQSGHAQSGSTSLLNADVDVEAGEPFALVDILGELVSYYTVNLPNAQTAAGLLLLVGQLLPHTRPLSKQATETTMAAYVEAFLAVGWAPEDIPALVDGHFKHPTNAGIQPMQIESILSTYHERLMECELFIDAAELRNMAYPAYPAVYEQDMEDTTVYLRCGECAQPINTGQGGLKCEACGSKQGHCPVCWCKKSPYGEARGLGSMMSACLLCGHSGHAACLFEFHLDPEMNDGGCPTEGCLCDCVDGPWREEKARLAAEEAKKVKVKGEGEGHRRVKSDEWKVGESRAAQRARVNLK